MGSSWAMWGHGWENNPPNRRKKPRSLGPGPAVNASTNTSSPPRSRPVVRYPPLTSGGTLPPDWLGAAHHRRAPWSAPPTNSSCARSTATSWSRELGRRPNRCAARKGAADQRRRTAAPVPHPTPSETPGENLGEVTRTGQRRGPSPPSIERRVGWARPVLPRRSTPRAPDTRPSRQSPRWSKAGDMLTATNRFPSTTGCRGPKSVSVPRGSLR